ncbi:MAG: flippase [Archaeoglobi archaeon]|nr:flippase [Candidatus Mnemosynella bozhongmuii]
MLARRVLRNAVYNSTSVLIGNLAGIIITIYVARALKPELFGIYSLALSVAFLLLTFTDLGVNGTLIRYGAHAHSRGDRELFRGYLRTLSKIKLLLASSTSLLVFILSDPVSEVVFQKTSLSAPLKIMSFFILFFSLSSFANSIFNALNDFRANLIKSIVYELSRLLFIPLFIFMGLSVLGALFGYVIAALLSLLVLSILLIRNHSSLIFGKASSVNLRRIMRFTGYLTIGSITWVVFAYVDSVMIGMFLPAEEVGYYRASYNIISAISGVVSIPSVLFPVFVHLEGRDLRNAFSRTFRYASILAIPSAFGLITIGEPLIRFVYGAEYLPSVRVLNILSFLIITSALGFWGILFNAKEKPEYPVYCSFFGMLVNIVLNYFLILRMGIEGAALATVISNAFVWSLLAHFSSRMFETRIDFRELFKILLSSVIMALILSALNFSSLPGAAAKIIFGALIYLTGIFLLGVLRKEDVDYLLSALKG